MHDVNVSTIYRIEWASLMFVVLEFAFLMFGKWLAKRFCNGLTELGTGAQREN
jgi:hypothetical protein